MTMTINEAIVKVLLTKYKKDAPEAFKMLEEAGYELVKNDGRWWVEKKQYPAELSYPHWKHVRFVEATSYYQKYKGEIVNERGRYIKIYDYKDLYKIDFEKMLNKPYVDRRVKSSKWEYRREALTSAKWGVSYESERVKEAQNKMRSAMSNFESAVRALERDKANLERLRKEYGLTK